eukprot:s2538_g3.t1
MFLRKSPLAQKTPLSVDQVRALEILMQATTDEIGCVLGQLLFCIHACCRWKDSQRLKSVATESAQGETLVHAEVLGSKAAVTLEAKTRFLPFMAIGAGISALNWADQWLAARERQQLVPAEFFLPSFSRRVNESIP